MIEVPVRFPRGAPGLDTSPLPQRFVDRHDDGDRPGYPLGSLRGRPAYRYDDLHLKANQIRREGRVPVVLALEPAELERDVPTLDIAQLA